MRAAPVVLRDGSEVLIRQVHRVDAALLADGFDRLSAQSRHLRFLAAKPELSTAELDYFTRVDHHDHEALGALDLVTGRGVGIARYVRQADDSKAAELAVTVADDWQRRGLGTELLSRLATRACQEGIRRFTALAAADNAAVRRLVEGTGSGLHTAYHGSGTVEYEVELLPAGFGNRLRAGNGGRELKSPTLIRNVLTTLIARRCRGCKQRRECCGSPNEDRDPAR